MHCTRSLLKCCSQELTLHSCVVRFNFRKFGKITIIFFFAEASTRTQWTEDEKEAVFNYFSHHIKKGRIPGKVDCEKCIDKAGGSLQRRDWKAVKYYVKNQIDKRNKVLVPKSTNQ